MNTKRVVGYLLLTCVLSQSCSLFHDCETPELSRNMPAWLPYEPNQMMFFESTAGKDTLIVIRFSTDWYNGPNKCAPVKDKMDVMIRSLQAFPDTLEFHALQEVLTFYPKNDTESRIHLTFYPEEERIDNVYPGRATFEESVSFDGKVFKDVIVASCIDCLFLKGLMFAKNRGVVAYKVGNVQWTRVE
jgi:hypothetical protein